MRFHLLTIGQRMPAWVDSGYQEYAKRMPRECTLELVELQTGSKQRNLPVAQRMTVEGGLLRAKIPARATIIALDERGKSWSSVALSVQLKAWMRSGGDVALLVGGADGLAPECKAAASQLWSLSPLTLPHGLVRVVVAEQLYRAWSILHNHPYHRA